MAQARLYVQKLAGRLNRAGSSIVAPAPEQDRAVDHPKPVRPRIAGRRRRSGIKCHRLEMALTFREVIPSCIRLVHMGIDIDSKHDSSFALLSGAAVYNSQNPTTRALSTLVYCTGRSLSRKDFPKCKYRLTQLAV